jgi:exopolysaccharide biosynthesis polyprenyl glycosylphosphotransferase
MAFDRERADLVRSPKHIGTADATAGGRDHLPRRPLGFPPQSESTRGYRPSWPASLATQETPSATASVRIGTSTGYPRLPRRAALPARRWLLRQREALRTEALHVGAVLVPVGVVLLATSGLSPGTLVIAGIAAAIWFAALRRSYSAMDLSARALGIGIASGIGVLMGLAAVSLLDFWLPGVGLEMGQLLFMTAGVFVASASSQGLARRFKSRRRVLIVGTVDGGTELLLDLARDPGLPFDCIGVVEDDTTHRPGNALHRGTMPELSEIVMRERPDLIVLGDGPCRAQALPHLLNSASVDFHVVGIDQFYEHVFGKVPVKHMSPIWFMSVLHLYQRPYSRITKRIFDLALALIGLAVAAPLFPVLALLVWLSGPGPIIFRQVRLGEGGKTFEMLKFRTMVDAAEEDGRPLWAAEDDARVTRVGSFMRSTRLDELPQLWNVIRGDMSFVGPRPERPEFLNLLHSEVPFWTSRHLVKPGITGWAQVHLGYTSDTAGAAEKLSYDLYYLRHRSVLLDVAIVASTTRTVFRGFTVHRNRRLPDPSRSSAF